jgi:predicted metal-binding protein
VIQVLIQPAKHLVFDDKVREACLSCKRYGTKATCPPNCGTVDYYRALLPRYELAVVLAEEFVIDTDDWRNLGRESSLTMQRVILAKRNEIFGQGYYFVEAFGAGSCKLCAECVVPCRSPDLGLVPIEATGLDVVKLAELCGIRLEFPVRETFYRIGVIFYG